MAFSRCPSRQVQSARDLSAVARRFVTRRQVWLEAATQIGHIREMSGRSRTSDSNESFLRSFRDFSLGARRVEFEF